MPASGSVNANRVEPLNGFGSANAISDGTPRRPGDVPAPFGSAFWTKSRVAYWTLPSKFAHSGSTLRPVRNSEPVSLHGASGGIGDAY